MGTVFSTFGALSAAEEVTYGTPVVPDWLTNEVRVNGTVDTSFDEDFTAPDLLTLNADFTPADRAPIKNDLSFSAAFTHMEDIIGGLPACHAALISSGHAVTGQGVAAGPGNFITYGPLSSNFGSASFASWEKEDEGDLTYVPNRGARGNSTFTITPGAGNLITDDWVGSALYERRPEFSALTPPTPNALPVYFAKCVSATIDSGGGAVDVPIAEFTFSPNYEVVAPTDDIEACASGLEEIQLEPQQMTGTLTLKYDELLIANADPLNFIRQFYSAEVDFELVILVDPGDGQTLTFTFPKCRAQAMNTADGDTRKQWTIDFVAQPVTTDDNYEIRFDVV